MQWGEWHRHWDLALGYYRPSDGKSGGSSVSNWLQVPETTEAETMDGRTTVFDRNLKKASIPKKRTYKTQMSTHIRVEFQNTWRRTNKI